MPADSGTSPSREGPSTMPATSSPSTAGCPTRSASAPNTLAPMSATANASRNAPRSMPWSTRADRNGKGLTSRMHPAPRLRARAASIAAVAAAAALVSLQLFVPPIVGLANNGDYGRMMDYAGVRYRAGTTPEQMYFLNIQREFELVRPVRSG